MGQVRQLSSFPETMATMINYMDRQTLANLVVRITEQFRLSQEQYGDIEFVFGVAFAFGAIFFGMVADRVSGSSRYCSFGDGTSRSRFSIAIGHSHRRVAKAGVMGGQQESWGQSRSHGDRAGVMGTEHLGGGGGGAAQELQPQGYSMFLGSFEPLE